MKTRIVKVRVFDTGEIYFQPQRKTWRGTWKPIEFYYKSDFVDMPGYMTSFATDEAQARKAIKNFVNKDFGLEVEQIIEVK